MINSSANYWIAANALSISLNALGEPNRCQCGLATGSVIMCYIKGVEGLEYDNGHNYRRWPLTISPTFFNDNAQKYVYVKIPRTSAIGTTAMICWPSQKIDIEGYVVDETGESTNERIGNDNFYYIWLQGIISEVRIDEGTAKRYFDSEPESGTLSTDEAVNPEETPWYEWNAITQTVTFLKEIYMGANSIFNNLKARVLTLAGHTLNSVAVDNTTPETSTTAIATPAYVNGINNNKYLRKDQDDATPYNLGVNKNLTVGRNLAVAGDGTIDGILRAFARVISNDVESQNWNGDGPFDSGFKLHKGDDGITHLVVDNLFVRMKAIFTELEIRKISYAGGNIIFSHAGSRVVAVKEIYDTCDVTFEGTTAVLDGSADFTDTKLNIHAGAEFDGTTLKFNDQTQRLVAYRCYLMEDDGTTATTNWWRVDDQARCQTFNIKAGVYQNVSNQFYWRRVIATGEEIPEGSDKNHYYVDLSVEDCIVGSTIPAAGDQLVQMGNRTDTTRQGFITIEVTDQGDGIAPAFKVYKNVNSYTLDNKRKICISPKLTDIRAQKFVIETEYDVMQVPNQRSDEWYTGMQCYYYDLVQHNGSLWLCTYPESGIGGVMYTTEEPSSHATYWRVYSGKGADGSSMLSVYAWNTDPDNGPAISGNAYPPTGWTTRITDRPGDGYYLWMAETIKSADGVIAPWGAPARISGDTGTPGEDAKDMEWIYRLDTSAGYDSKTGTANGQPISGKTGDDWNADLVDDFVPTNWSDNALSISTNHKNVYAACRKYNTATGKWGDFSTPIVWSHWGERGIDGDGVEYVFIRTNTDTAPTITDSTSDYDGKHWYDDDYRPLSSVGRCTDDPAGVDESHKYEWASVRTKGDPNADGERTWEKYSGTMKLWNNYSTSVFFADIDNEMDSVACDVSGKASAAYDKYINVSMWHGSEEQALTKLTTTSISGITITPDMANKRIRVQVAQNATLAERNDITITIACADSGDRTLHFILNGVRAGGQGENATLYSLVPNVASVVKKKDGTYSTDNVSCTRQKIKGSTITNDTTDGTITYKIDGEATEHSYTNNQNIAVTSITRNIQFIFKVDSKIVDIETIPLVADGTDGEVVAAAICTPMLVSIPCDNNGRVLADFKKEVVVGMSTNSEEISLTDVQITAGGDNVTLGPATLESHSDSKTTFSGNKAVIGDGGFSGNTLVLDDLGSTLVSKRLIVTAAKGATLTEHTCELEVQGYDSTKALFTSKTSFVIQRNTQGVDGQPGTDGKNGENGINVIATPSSLIVNQGLGDEKNNLSSLSERIEFTVMKGTTQITPNRVEITAQNHCTASGSTSNYATLTAIGQSSGKYYDTADFTVRVTYVDGGYTRTVSGIKIDVYANLLGTWSDTVENGAQIIAAHQAVVEMDDRGVPAKNTYDYNAVRSAAISAEEWHSSMVAQDGWINSTNIRISTAERNINALQTTVGDANGGLVKSVNTLTEDATQAKRDITQIKGKYIDLADVDAWEQGTTTGESTSKGYTPRTEGGIKTVSGDSYHTLCIRTVNLIPVTNGSLLVFNHSNDYELEIENFDANGKWQSVGGWQSMAASNISSGKIGVNSSAKYICVLVRKANQTAITVADDLSKITISVVNNPTVSSSEVTQTATNISATVQSNIEGKLATTGIKIQGDTREVHLIAGKVSFRNSADTAANEYFTVDSTGKMTAKGGGEVGGFDIGTSTLGPVDHVTSNGWTTLYNNGAVSIHNNDTSRNALYVNGGVTLLGTANQNIIIRDNNGSVTLSGSTLNINADGQNGSVTYIGNNQSSVTVNGTTTFSVGVNLNGTTQIGSSGALKVQGALHIVGDNFVTNGISTEKTYTLPTPSTANNGQMIFAKGTVGNLKVQCTNKIRNSEGSIVSSVGPDKRSRIFISDGSYWNEWYCS